MVFLFVLLIAVYFYMKLLGNALRYASASRIEERISDRTQRSRIEQKFAREDDLVRATDTAGIITGAAAVATLCVLFRTSGLGEFLYGFVSAICALLVANILANGLGRSHAERLALGGLDLAIAIEGVLHPVHRVLDAIEKIILNVSGPTGPCPEERIEEEIREVISEGEREGAIEEDAREMIENIIEFRDLDVGLLMTPRTEMIAIEDTSSLDEATAMVLASGHSRLPVYRENRDHVVGVLYERDLLAAREKAASGSALCELMREPYFVPENMRVREFLKELKKRGVHLGVVLDEYGGTAGIITFADVIEEIIGDLPDEHGPEVEEEEITLEGERVALVSGKVRIDELNEHMDLRLPENESFDTIGGLAATISGHVPSRGEEIRYRQIRLTVLDADKRSVRRLRIEVLDDPGEDV